MAFKTSAYLQIIEREIILQSVKSVEGLGRDNSTFFFSYKYGFDNIFIYNYDRPIELLKSRRARKYPVFDPKKS